MIKNLLLVSTRRLSLMLLCSFLLLGCVSKKKFIEQGSQYENSRDSLLVIVQSLDYEKDTLHLALAYEKGANAALLTTQDRLQDRLDVLQKEIDRLGENASTREQLLLSEISDKKVKINNLSTGLEAVQSIMIENNQRLLLLEAAINPFTQDFDEGLVLIRKRTGQLLITINENALFRPSSTSKLINKGKTFLEKVGETLLKYPEFKVQVLGHTDNKDNGRQSLDNWQYSALRAVSVVKYLTEYTDLGANRVIAASKSEYAPLESNETKEGRASNRRIELIIAPPLGFLEQKAINIIDDVLKD